MCRDSAILKLKGDYMNIEQAIDIIYTGLVSEKSVPVKLRSHKELDLEQLDQVKEALDFAIMNLAKYIQSQA